MALLTTRCLREFVCGVKTIGKELKWLLPELRADLDAADVERNRLISRQIEVSELHILLEVIG